jgi:hypothetical protein
VTETLVTNDRVLEFKLRVQVNPHRTWNQTTCEWVDRVVPFFTPDQWVFIERVAFETLREMIGTQIEELITPEVEFGMPPEGVFPNDMEDGISEEELDKRVDFRLEACGAVIDVLEAFTSQLDEEIGKRDI